MGEKTRETMNEMRIVPAIFFGTLFGTILTLMITTDVLPNMLETLLRDPAIQLQFGLIIACIIIAYHLLGIATIEDK